MTIKMSCGICRLLHARWQSCVTLLLLVSIYTMTTTAEGRRKDATMATNAVNSSQNENSSCNCKHPHKILDDMDGSISWTDPDPACGQSWSWTVQLPDAYGIGVQFHDVQMTQNRFLHIYGRNSTNAAPSDWILMRKFTENDGNSSHFYVRLDLSPLLVNSSQLKIVTDVTPKKPSNAVPASFFNVSYSAHLLQAMPYVHEQCRSVVGDLCFTTTTYSCSKGNVPKVLRCNKILECKGGEDEADCDYRNTGCGDWVPYKGLCLKATFVQSCPYPCGSIGDLHFNLPDNAEDICQRWYNAHLAVIPDSTGLDLVASIVQQSGFRSVSLNIRKVRPVNKRLHHLYRHLWQWGGKGGPIAYEQQQLEMVGPEHSCAMFNIYPHQHFIPMDCKHLFQFVYPDGFVCMKPNPSFSDVPTSTINSVSFPRPAQPSRDMLQGIETKECPDGSLVHIFQQCRWDGLELSSDWSPNNFPVFQCRFGLQVHYSLICNGNDECADGSDEENCVLPRFLPQRKWFVCENHQVIHNQGRWGRCNGYPECFDESDEEDCSRCKPGTFLCSGTGCIPRNFGLDFDSCPYLKQDQSSNARLALTGKVSLNNYGTSHIKPIGKNDTKFLFDCQDGLFIPSYLVNNGEKDCADGKDEKVPIGKLHCPGHFRCQKSGTCLHLSLVCDGVHHCPYKDDELYCKFSYRCPDNCTCEGYAFSCHSMFDTAKYPSPRYLDLSGTADLSFENFQLMEFLYFLNLSNCRLNNITLTDIPSLRILDLSFNHLVRLSSLVLKNLLRLTYIDLSNNPFVTILDSSFGAFMNQSGLINVKTLIIKNTNLNTIQDMAFSLSPSLETLDFRGSPLENYDVGVFDGLTNLATIRTDDPKLCCPYFQSAVVIKECTAPIDELSSCSNLLRSVFFRIFLWIIAALALTGNTGVIVYRCIVNEKMKPAFRVLVMNLCAADFLMGVYMLIIGSADVHFQNVYVSVEKEWRHSVACGAAGFLAFVSSEASAFVICLITLDRLLVICFPLKKHLHLTVVHAVLACLAVWMVSITLAALPLLTQMQFYEQTAMCLPLPITRHNFSGKRYAFGVFITLNFFLVVITGAGQILIYRAIRKAAVAAGTGRRQQEMAVARRLFLVVFTDFCCWFPVGLMGFLAAAGTPIPGVINIWTAVFVLPINSALNPFLYTLNGVLENMRKQRMEERMRRTIRNLKTEIPKWRPELVEETVRICIQTKRVSQENILRWMRLSCSEETSLSRVSSPLEQSSEL